MWLGAAPILFDGEIISPQVQQLVETYICPIFTSAFHNQHS